MTMAGIMDPYEADQLRGEFDRLKEVDRSPGYVGTGIWIRIQHRFRTRMTEWMLAGIMALWGLIVLLPAKTFDQPDYAGFREIFGREEILGASMMTIGLLRILGLIVNGARKNVTPHIRMFSACCGCIIFTGMTYCSALSGIMSPWLAVYPMFVVGELTNIYRAAHDVGESYGRPR